MNPQIARYPMDALYPSNAPQTLASEPSAPITPAERVTQVAGTIKGLHDAASEQEQFVIDLHRCLDLLEQRLSPVLRATPPAAGTEGHAEPEHGGVPLAQQLSIAGSRFTANTRGVHAAIKRVVDLNERLEL